MEFGTEPTVIRTTTDEPRCESVLVIGGEAAKGLAAQLEEYRVTFASGSDEVVRTARRAGLDANHVDPTDGSDIRSLEFDGAVAIVATERDRVNLLASQLLRTVSGVAHVVVWLHDSSNRDVYDDIDVDLVEAHHSLSHSVSKSLAADEDG